MQKPFNSQYYEAIIQLRPANEGIFNYVISMVENRKNVFVSKILAKKFGYDLYISDIRYALAIGKKLKTKFNGTLKTSRELYSYDRQTSKKKYRVVVCFRLAEKNEEQEDF